MDIAEWMGLPDTGVAEIIQSDMLEPLRELATFIPVLRAMGLPAQFRVIIDANVAFRELIWLTGRRKNPSAGTALQEMVASKTVVAFAPTWLDDEVREHAEEMAAKAGVSVDRYLLEWEAYRAAIIFVEPKAGKKPSAIDPDDDAYVWVYEEIGAHAVYSGDRHISRMGASTIDRDVIVTLRQYSRAASWQYTIKYGGVIAVGISWHTLVASLRMLAGIAALIRSSPDWVKVLLLASAVALIGHPRSRAWLVERAESIGGSLCVAGTATGQMLVQLGAEAVLKTQEAREALSTVDRHLSRRTIPLRVLMRAVCLQERRPVPLNEIERRVLANGYDTRAKEFRSYVRRVLRECEDFVEVGGRWTCTH